MWIRASAINNSSTTTSRPRRSAIIRPSWSSIISPAPARSPRACRCSPGWRRKPGRCGSAPPCWCCPGTIRCCSPSRPPRSICCPADGSISASARATGTTNSPASASRSRRPTRASRNASTSIVKSWTAKERFSHHGKYWHFDDIIVEPPTAQKPHPPMWMAAGSPHSIRQVAARGYNLLLDQFASLDAIGERVAWFKAEVEKRGRVFDPLEVGVGARLLSWPRTRPTRRPRWSSGSRRSAISPPSRKRPTARRARPASWPSPTPARRARKRPSTERRTRSRLKLEKLQKLGVEYILLNGGGLPRMRKPAPLRARTDAGLRAARAQLREDRRLRDATIRSRRRADRG